MLEKLVQLEVTVTDAKTAIADEIRSVRALVTNEIVATEEATKNLVDALTDTHQTTLAGFDEAVKTFGTVLDAVRERLVLSHEDTLKTVEAESASRAKVLQGAGDAPHDHTLL